MANNQIAATLVARFLKANHYEKTLEAFLEETNLTEKAAVTKPGDWTLEKLIEEKIQFDTSLNFTRKDETATQGWTQPAPSVSSDPDLPINTNVLSVHGGNEMNTIAVSTANTICSFVSASPPYISVPDSTCKADSPILSSRFLGNNQMASTTMSGKLTIYNISNGNIITERRDHSKWAVNLATHYLETSECTIIATAGWDQKVHLYHTTQSSSEEPLTLPPPFHTITLPSNPESLLFVRNPDIPDPSIIYLILSRRDSSFLYYYRMTIDSSSTSQVLTVHPASRQNLAPHSNAWVSFTPSALALSPVDPTLLAIATSHLPHLKVIIVRLLFPEPEQDHPTSQNYSGTSQPATQALQARAALALQDIEDRAITVQVSTQAPQTPYSTPQIAWRPDGSGVWVNGDDGVVRGVEAKSGKVVALLRGHEVGSKVRTLWAGVVGGEERGSVREVLVSGGFDRRCLIWDIAK